VDISTVSKILLYFFRATVNEVRLDNVYIDTCNSSGRVMDWSVMLEILTFWFGIDKILSYKDVLFINNLYCT